MAYRVKDLMINIVGAQAQEPHCEMSSGQLCPPATILCRGGSWTTLTLTFGAFCAAFTQICEGISPGTLTHWTWTFTTFCPTATGFCRGVSRTTTPWMICPEASDCRTASPTAGAAPFPGDPALAAEQLAALKAHLKEALEEVERQEVIANEQAQPQTRAQIEELEAKMTDALAELRKRKSALKED